jgi:phosphoserine phosphatase
MILGDIGDASIALMLENEIDIGFTWSEYLELQRIGDVQKAFRMASNIFNGFETDCIKRLANAVVKIENHEIVFFEKDTVFRVNIPRPNPVMIELVKLLHKFEFKIHIISSSNQYLVNHLAKLYFDIENDLVHGINHKIRQFKGVDVLTDSIIEPTPIDAGKVDVYREFVGMTDPIIFGGDSVYDLPISCKVADQGIIFWLGDESLVEKIDSVNRQLVLI